MLPGAFIGQNSELVVYSSFCYGESDGMFVGKSPIFFFFLGSLIDYKNNRNYYVVLFLVVSLYLPKSQKHLMDLMEHNVILVTL